jgi:hypothetical protein
MMGGAQALESTYARIAKHRVDRLRHLLDHPGILAADSSASRFLAFTKTVALQDSAADMDRNVGGFGSYHCPVARRGAL